MGWLTHPTALNTSSPKPWRVAFIATFHVCGFRLSSFRYLISHTQRLIELSLLLSGFEGGDEFDAGKKKAAEDNNKIEVERDTVSPLRSVVSWADKPPEGAGVPGGTTRKLTREAMISSREQKRTECVKKCRAVAEELSITDNGTIYEMDKLLEDKARRKWSCYYCR